MSILTSLHQQTYKENFMLAMQQMGFALQDSVSVQAGCAGSVASPVTLVNKITAQKKTAVNQDTPVSGQGFQRRWITPVAWNLGELYDWDDISKAMAGYNPEDPTIRSFVEALSRAKDNTILANIFATATIGQQAGSTVTLPSSQDVAITVGGAASALNPTKLKNAQEILRAAGSIMPGDKMVCVINAKQNTALLKNAEIVNTEYMMSGQTAIEDGFIKRYMGIEFVHVEFSNEIDYPDAYAQLISGTTAYVPLFLKSGLYLGEWVDMEVTTSIAYDKSNAIRVYAATQIGASRVDEKKVVKIACNNA